MDVGLSLGSNVGNRLANLVSARDRIASLPDMEVIAASPVYETEPVGVAEQHQDDWFLNAALILSTQLPLQDLQARLHAIEDALGRLRDEGDRNAPRMIDIDIICADGPPVCTKDLHVPHPRWKERRFVVEPLAAIRPDWIIPAETQTPAEVLATLPQEPATRMFTRQW